MTTKNVPIPQSQSMYAGATQKTVAPLQWAVDSAQGNTKVSNGWIQRLFQGIGPSPCSQIVRRGNEPIGTDRMRLTYPKQ